VILIVRYPTLNALIVPFLIQRRTVLRHTPSISAASLGLYNFSNISHSLPCCFCDTCNNFRHLVKSLWTHEDKSAIVCMLVFKQSTLTPSSLCLHWVPLFCASMRIITHNSAHVNTYQCTSTHFVIVYKKEACFLCSTTTSLKFADYKE
jgi:hypothetical protein